MQETLNERMIHGDPDRVFALAAAVEDWPSFLPHYRWVRVLANDGERRTVQMAARHLGLPVQWTSYQWREPAARRIRFLHVGGLSRGMEVEWRIQPVARGGAAPGATRVTIWHALALEVPLVRTPPGRWVVGNLFVRQIASRTLAYLQARVEAEGG
jgi:ribosome-associated toxin RatA of RatAB toxin-antitoxin module